MKGRRDSLRYGMAGVLPFNTVDYSKSDADYADYGEVGSDKMLEIQAQLDAEERERDLASLTSEAPSFLTDPSSTMYSGSVIEPSEEDKSDLTFLNVWRLANVQGHSVNLSKKQEQLTTTEGKWLPEIAAALEYLTNKKQILQLSNDNDGSPEAMKVMDDLLQRNNELEGQLKNSARSNPYLTDIFYETNPGKVLSKKEFGLKDLVNYYTYDLIADDYLADIDPTNNLKHQLSTGGLKSIFGNTHKLNDEQLNAMWGMRNLYDAKTIDKQILNLLKAGESAKLQFDEKNSDILDKLNTVKKGNFLFDPTLIDPEFTKKFQENEIELTDPKSWAYALPHLGSSYSELGTTIALMGASAMLHNVAKGALATTTGGTLPLLYAITEAGTMMALNHYQRESETASEAFDNYQLRVLSEVDKLNIDIDKVNKELVPLLLKYGYDTENMDDYTKFQAILATGLKSTNTTFNDIVKDSREGIEVLKETNRALSAGDYAESLMFSYGGAYLSKLYGANKLKSAMLGKFDNNMLNSNVARAIEEDPIRLSNLPLFDAGSKLLNRGVTRVANKIANPITKIALKDGINTISNIGKKAGVSYFVERTEEGQQYTVGKRYREGKYDNVQDYTFLDGLVNAAQLGVEANAAYYGLHPDNNLNTDEELMKNMSIGGFTGLFMTGVYSAPDTYKNLRLTVTDVKLRALAADDYAKAETDLKVDQFLNMGIKKGDLTYVTNTLQQLKANKPNGVTDEMIDDDIVLARDIVAYNGTKHAKDIASNSSKYNLGTDLEKTLSDFVKNAIHIQNRYRQLAKTANESVENLSSIIDGIINSSMSESEEGSVLEAIIKELYEGYKKQIGDKLDIPEYTTYKQSLLNQLVLYKLYDAALRLQKDLKARANSLQQLAEDRPELLVNTKDIGNIAEFIDRRIEDLEASTKLIREVLSSQELQQYVVLPGLENLDQAVGSSLINSAASENLLLHRNAYIFGTYEGKIEGKEDANARAKAKLLIVEDILRRRAQESIAKEEKSEQFNVDTEPGQQEVELNEEKIEKEVELEKQELEEEVIPVSPPAPTIVDLVDEEEKDTDKADLPTTDEVKEEKSTLIDEVKLVDDVTAALLNLDLILTPKPEIPLLEMADKAEMTTTEDSELEVELNLENLPKGETNEAIEAAINEAVELTDTQSGNAVEEVFNKVESGTFVPELDDDTPIDQAEEVKKDTKDAVEEIVKKDAEQDKPSPKEVEIPTTKIDKPITPSLEEEGVTPVDGLQGEPLLIFIDPITDEVMWDPTGQGNMDNSILIDAPLIEMLNEFDSNLENTILGPGDFMNSRENVDKLEGLDDKTKQKKNRVKNTFFYLPTSTEVMPIQVAGKPIEITTKDGKVAKRGPGAELASKLTQPGWLKSADDIYYIVTSSTHDIVNPYSDLAVHMLIEKDGIVYNTSLRAITDDLKSDLRYLGLTQEEVDAEINALRALRKKIIDAYSAEYFSTGKLPLTALKHVKPVNLRISNGTIDNVKIGVGETTRPVYRKLNSIPQFGMSTDPLELSELITTGEIELGYGLGAFTQGEPYSIRKLDESEDTSVQGTGYAGKIYYIPKPSQTPSQRVTLPIMLAEELHTIDTSDVDKVLLATDSKGNRMRDSDGKLVPMSTAELVFNLLTSEVFGTEIDNALLSILANTGSRTVTIGLSDTEQSKLNFLVRKLLHVFTNAKGELILLRGGRKNLYDASSGYTTRYNPIKTLTDAQKRRAVLEISLNIHWNTDKKVMSGAIPQPIIDAVLSTARLHPENDDNTQYPFGNDKITFSLKDVGYTIKEGKVVKVSDKTPIVASWMINHGILKTDVSELVFRAPFVYADNVSISETKVVNTKPTAKPIAKKEVTSKGEPVKTEATKKGATEAIPATPENLAKYGLEIPKDRGLLSGRAWGIYPDKATGVMKVGPVPKQFIKGVYSIVLGNGQMDYTEAKAWLIKTLGLDVTQVRVVNGAMRMLSDAKVYGVMQVALDTVRNELVPSITLSKLAGKGIEFHEAWHYVSLLLLNDTERQAIYTEYLDNNPKAEDYTNAEIEEALAEEFRSWMLKETSPGITAKIMSFFRHLKEFVMKLSKGNSKYYAFDAIRRGHFKKYSPNLDALKQFGEAYLNGVFYYIPGVSTEEQLRMPSITDSNVFYDIVDSLTSSALTLLNIRSSEDIEKARIDVIFDYLQEELDNDWLLDSSTQLAEEVIANKDVFKKYIYDRLDELKLKEIERIETEEANRLLTETGDTPDNTWDKNQGDTSKKANVAFNAKLFFYSIPKVKDIFVTEEDGTVVKQRVPELDPLFNLPVTEQFDIVWNMVMENMWSCETINDPEDENSLINVAARMANTEPFFDSLYKILTSTENPISENTMTLLIDTIKSSKNSMTTLIIKPVKLTALEYNASDAQLMAAAEEDKKPIFFTWEARDSDTLRKIRRYPRQWSNAFFTSANVEVADDGSRKVSVGGYKYLSIRRLKISSILKLASKGKLDNAKLAIKLQEVEDTFLEICNALKIPFDRKALDYMLNQFPESTKPTKNSELNKFYQFWEARGQSFNGGTLSDIVKMYNSKSSSILDRSGKVMRSLDRIFTNSNEKAQINLMAVAYGKTHPSPEEFSVTGADKSLIYPISENNYMSDLIRWLNGNYNNKILNIKDTPYSASSLLAKLIELNGKGNYKLHTLIAIDDDLSGSSRDYFGISPLEDYIAKLTITLKIPSDWEKLQEGELVYGDLVLPTMSDKKTWYSISGLAIPKLLLRSVTSAFSGDLTSELTSALSTTSRRFSNSALEIMSNYFKDELNAVIKYYGNKAYIESHPEEWVQNYHGQLADGKMQPGGNGGRFRYFNQLDFNGETEFLNRSLAKYEKYETTEKVVEYLNSIKELIEGDPTLLLDAINSMLLLNTANEIDKLSSSNLGILNKNKDGSYSNKLIPDNIYKYYKNLLKKTAYANEKQREEDILYSIIGTHVLMNIISIQELEKCFTGDPAYYTWKLTTIEEDGMSYEVPSARDIDKTKRLSSVLSTGTNLRTYWGVGDPRNDTKFTVMNLTDNEVYSSYYNKLKDIFRTSLIRDMFSDNNPGMSDDYLMESTDTPLKVLKIYDSLTPDLKAFVDKQSINSANPYGYKEKNGVRKGNINQANAAVYIRPVMYKRILEALGEWNNEIEEAYNILEGDDENWINDERYNKALALIIKPLKMAYFGDHFNDTLGLNIPVYDKMAIFPMFKVLAKADNELLYNRMNDESLGTIDMIAFESAIKVGGRQLFLTYNDSENELFNEEGLFKPSYAKYGEVGNLPVYIQDLTLLRLQLNTDPHEHPERSFGTQAAKICLGNIIDDRTYGSNKGISVKGSDIKSVAMGVINALADKGRSAVMHRFFEGESINNLALSDYLISQAKSSGLSRELMEGLTLDENGEFKTPLAAMSIRGWVESRIISLVNKECIDINTPGGSAIQMASYGYKATGARKQTATDRAFNNGEDLLFLNDDGSMDVMLSMNFFKHVVPEEFLANFGSMRKWLFDNDVIGKNAKPFGIGYRIPTQGLSSTFAFKVMDVLPSSVGDTIVVPNEFTGMTGSDFDVDKIYLATRSYDKEGKLHEFDDSIDQYKKQSVGALLNKLIDMYTAVVSDDKNMAETRASIDTLTDIMKSDIVKLVKPKLKDEALPFYEMMPTFQLSRKKLYTGGKMGIAPFALNSTNHCLTLVTHLTMNYSKGNPYKLGTLDAIKGKDGFKILDWLSAMINANVDVAKDPYIMDLNVNKVNYNMTALLLRGGMGESTFYYLAQPILKTFADMKIASDGIYGATKYYDNQIIGALTDLYELLLKDAILKLDPTSELYKEYVGKLNGWIADRPEASSPKVQARRTSKIAAPTIEDADIDRNSTFDKKALVSSLLNIGTVLHLYQLLIVLKAYSELSTDADVLGQLVQVSLIDTKKYGNNLISQLDFNNKYNVFKQENYAKFSLTNEETVAELKPLEDYFSKTFLLKKLELGIGLPRRILRSQSFVATKLFSDMFTSTMSTFGEQVTWLDQNGLVLRGYKGFYDREKVVEVGKLLETVLRARISKQSDLFNISDLKLVSMLYGKNTMSKRLSGIKLYLISNKDEFPLLVNQDGSIRNELLNYLLEYSGDGVTQLMDRIILFNSSMNNSRTTEDRLVSAFSDLLESEDAAVRDFAEDLATYAYITSYDNTGVNSFFHLVPVWWKLGKQYVDNIKQALYDFSYDPENGAQSVAEDYDIPQAGYYPSIYTTIARNMWRDESVVKLYTPDYSKGDKDLFTTKVRFGKTTSYVPLTFASDKVNEKYITINKTPDSSKALLYRLVATAGYINEVTGSTKLKYIYQLVPKLGVKDGEQFYELLKDSLEPSAFASNAFDLDVTPDFDLIHEKAMASIKKPDNPDFVPFFEPIQQAMIKSFMRTDLDTDLYSQDTLLSDNTVSVGDELTLDDSYNSLPDLSTEELEADSLFFIEANDFTFTATEMEEATFDLSNEIVDTITVGEEFAAQSEDLTVPVSLEESSEITNMEENDNTTDFSDDAYKACKG